MNLMRRENFYFRLGILTVICGIWKENYFIILASLILICTAEILNAIRKESK